MIHSTGSVTRIITVANTKGGTGKTTTCLNLSTELALAGYRVLKIDLDPQGSLSKAVLGADSLPNYKGIEELLSKRVEDPVRCIADTRTPGVQIIPSHSELGEESLKMIQNASFFALKDIIRKISGYDYIIIDTHPSKNILMLNAFSASDYVLIPTNPGVYPLMDIVELEEIILSTAANTNPLLEIAGVLITMVPRGTVYRQLEKDVRDYFGGKVFKTTISRLCKSEESALEGVGISILDTGCKLSLQYKALSAELITRMGTDSKLIRTDEQNS